MYTVDIEAEEFWYATSHVERRSAKTPKVLASISPNSKLPPSWKMHTILQIDLSHTSEGRVNLARIETNVTMRLPGQVGIQLRKCCNVRFSLL